MAEGEENTRAVLAWLLAQYQDIEHTAREAALDDVPEWEIRNGRIMGADPRYYSVIVDHSVEPTPWQRRHMVLHDPRAVLADLAVKHAILAESCADSTTEGQSLARRTILWLARALAHRPGYCVEWRPSDDDMLASTSLERLAKVVKVSKWGR